MAASYPRWGHVREQYSGYHEMFAGLRSVKQFLIRLKGVLEKDKYTISFSILAS